MAVNKNFVVKNGFEVNNDLIFANADTNKVGIGSTGPRVELDVRGGIGVTDINAVGVVTVGSELRVGTYGNVFSVISSGSSVGVGTNLPGYLLDIRSPVSIGQTAIYVQGDGRFTGNVNIEGDLFVDDITFDQAELNYLNVTGFGTVSSLFVPNVASIKTGIVTFIEGVNLNYSGIGTVVTLTGTSVQVENIDATGIGTVVTLTGTSIQVENVDATGVSTFANLTGTNLNFSGIGTFASIDINAGDLEVANLDATDINVTGISTLGTVLISSGIITATTGIITYYGDGSNLIGAGLGIGSTGGLVGYGVTFINFYGPGVSTAYYDGNTGIATVYFQGGGGGGGAIGIGSTFPGTPASLDPAPSSGDLFFHINYGRTFIYYDEVDLGIGSTAVWVDAAPFNIGIVTSTIGSLPAGTALTPSLAFVSDTSTGLFSPAGGQQTFVSVGASILNINQGGINVTGVVTATSFRGDGSNLTNLPAGLGTALSSDQTSPLNKIYYTDQVLSIGSTVTIDPPSTAKVAYTQYAEILVDGDADLIVADGDDFIPNILGIGTTGTVGTIGGGGRVRADNFSNRSGTGAPTFNAGLNVTGVVTATGGFNLGISSAGTTITSGPVKILNFVGTGNTFAVDGTTVNISIQGGGGGTTSLDITSSLFI